MRNLTLLCLGVVAIVAIASSSQANTSGPFTTSTPISYTLTDWSNSLSFPKFNSALGTLTEVDLTFNAGMETTLSITNDSDSGSSGSANTNVQVSVDDPGSYFSPPQVNFLSPTYYYTLAGGGNTTSGLLTSTGSYTGNLTLAGILAEFNGPGTIVLPASTFTQTYLANTGGNTAAEQVTDASLTGTVTYQYTPTPTPEPGTLVLLGMGAIGLLGFAWRRRVAA